MLSPSSDVTKFTVSSKGTTNHMSVSDVFVSFFCECHRTSFKMDENSEAWKEDMDVPKRRTHNNLFAEIKSTIRFFNASR